MCHVSLLFQQTESELDIAVVNNFDFQVGLLYYFQR
jgi:hypothetical protein